MSYRLFSRELDGDAVEDIVRTAHAFQHFCSDRNWEFCFIRGLALQYWGRPRVTRDVDVCLLTGFGSEETYITALLQAYASRVDDAQEFALTNRILLLTTPGGIGLDVSLGGIPFEERVVQRATEAEYLPDVRLRICSAEDLVVLKAFADRLQDWAARRPLPSAVTSVTCWGLAGSPADQALS